MKKIALEEALFLGQLGFFVYLIYLKINSLIELGDNQNNLTWSSVFTNFTFITITFGFGFMLNMLKLNITIATLFKFESLLYKVYWALFIASIIAMFYKIPYRVKAYKPQRGYNRVQ